MLPEDVFIVHTMCSNRRMWFLLSSLYTSHTEPSLPRRGYVVGIVYRERKNVGMLYILLQAEAKSFLQPISRRGGEGVVNELEN